MGCEQVNKQEITLHMSYSICLYIGPMILREKKDSIMGFLTDRTMLSLHPSHGQSMSLIKAKKKKHSIKNVFKN